VSPNHRDNNSFEIHFILPECGVDATSVETLSRGNSVESFEIHFILPESGVDATSVETLERI